MQRHKYLNRGEDFIFHYPFYVVQFYCTQKPDLQWTTTPRIRAKSVPQKDPRQVPEGDQTTKDVATGLGGSTDEREAMIQDIIARLRDPPPHLAVLFEAVRKYERDLFAIELMKMAIAADQERVAPVEGEVRASPGTGNSSQIERPSSREGASKMPSPRSMFRGDKDKGPQEELNKDGGKS
ncbi:hypothetical protein CBER1_09314 [Cercospora berteroae]|uniref:Uncharacterized protein n=1 Tax=Cercospora berteroae TaxID=357750 RepID=A0A2S6BX09_9PEZI|nr:hypothetical protein CBER1_09314 [Cercospora berteroae]